jgi:hypothetical protein
VLAVAAVETGGDLYAVNKASGAYGIIQIRQAALTDLNQAFQSSYTLTDFLGNWELSVWAFREYGLLYGARTPEDYVRVWKGGKRGRNREGTTRYWRRVRNLLNEGQPPAQREVAP